MRGHIGDKMNNGIFGKIVYLLGISLRRDENKKGWR